MKRKYKQNKSNPGKVVSEVTSLEAFKKMKGVELFDFNLGEKVYALDTFHDESANLIAVGLRNTILVYQIDETDEMETKPTLIQAVTILFKIFKLFKYIFLLSFR